MATAEESTESPGEKYIGAKVSEEKRRLVKMRAAQLGKNVSDYIRDLVDEDIDDAQLPALE